MPVAVDESAKYRPTAPKPIRPLVATALLLVLILIISAFMISVAHRILSKRMDRFVLDETIRISKEDIERGKVGNAETLLIDVVRARPALLPELAWQFSDDWVILPRFSHFIAVADSAAADSLASEMELRFGGAVSQSRLPDAFANNPVEVLSDASTAVAEADPRALPEELRVQARAAATASNPFASARYALLYERDRTRAKDLFQRDWAEHSRSDSAFWLGVIAELEGRPDSARDWYANALQQSRSHLGAAKALGRLANES
ncbi:MAG: hypothetical protein AMXMBFR84_30580 [Candidatus Hydrogenedentota bacterium]